MCHNKIFYSPMTLFYCFKVIYWDWKAFESDLGGLWMPLLHPCLSNYLTCCNQSVLWQHLLVWVYQLPSRVSITLPTCCVENRPFQSQRWHWGGETIRSVAVLIPASTKVLIKPLARFPVSLHYVQRKNCPADVNSRKKKKLMLLNAEIQRRLMCTL